MRKRGHFDASALELIESRLGELQQIVSDVKSGNETFVSAARKHSFNYGMMRRIFYSLEKIDEPECEAKEISFPKNENTISLLERFYSCVFNSSPSTEAFAHILPPDASATLQYLCSYPQEFNLSNRDGKLLYLRYIDGLTLSQVGEQLGISRERARQLLYRTLKALRNPLRSDFLRMGIGAYQKSNQDWKNRRKILERQYLEDIEKTDQELERLKLSLGEKLKEVEKLQEAETILAQFSSIPITGLGLSNRSIHALQFAGIKTLEELLGMTAKEVKSLRNIGRKSAKEISSVIRQYDPDWR